MRILITGGTGSLGRVLTKHFYDQGHEVVVYSRDPHKQLLLKRELGENASSVSFVLGDVCDWEKVLYACENTDYVVHSAALKHVNLGEQHVEEYIRVNVNGTLSVAKACYQAGVRGALMISTDKSVSPINLYGKTKAVAEDIFLSFGYSALRYGNVVSSDGSIFKEWYLNTPKRVVLRAPLPTRFFLTMEKAISLVDDAMSVSGNDVYIPLGLSAVDVISVVMALGIDYDTEPLLPGEKQHEALLSKHESVFRIYKEVGDRIAIARKGYFPNELPRSQFYSNDAVKFLSQDEILARFREIWPL